MKWSEKAWKSIESIYNRILELPFIQELMNGTLPREKFLFYLQQDAIYLIEYGKVLAGIAAKVSQPEYMQAFLKFTADTVSVERALHESYLKDIGQTVRIEASPSCMLYTGFIHAQLSGKPIEVALAGVLPCFWIYKKAGDHILYNQIRTENPYQPWIDTYGGKEFAQAVTQAITICDEVAATCTEAQQMAMTDAFILASKMEWMFWDSAWHMEQWPL